MAPNTALPPDRRPIVISGPSGVGKGTLPQRILDTHPDIFAVSVSHITRSPRPGEVEGLNYYFVSPDTFSSLISQHVFIEHAVFSGHRYGTSKQTITDQTAKGLIAVLDIDMNGARNLKADSSIDARYVFVKPSSFEALEAQLRGRGTENEDDLQKRLNQARVELEYASTPGVYDKIIVNGDLDEAYKGLEEFVYRPVS